MDSSEELAVSKFEWLFFFDFYIMKFKLYNFMLWIFFFEIIIYNGIDVKIIKFSTNYLNYNMI